MISINLSAAELSELRYYRFYHPDPIVMRRCEVILLRAGGYILHPAINWLFFALRTLRQTCFYHNLPN